MTIAYTAPVTSKTKATANRPRWNTRGKMGEYVVLSKHDLKVDHVYQRAVSKTKALEYAKNWSWVACGAISIALRTERGKTEFWVMDGQNRVAAALLRDDIEELPCLCFEVESLEEEATGFVEINLHRGAPNSTDKYRAMLVARDRVALEIDALIKRHTARVVAGYSAGTTVSCVGVLLMLWKANPQVLERIFPLAVELMEGHPFHRDVVSGLYWLESAMLGGHSLLNARWEKRIIDLGVKKLREGITETSAYLGKRTGRSAGLGILKVINSGLRMKLEINEQTPGDATLL